MGGVQQTVPLKLLWAGIHSIVQVFIPLLLSFLTLWNNIIFFIKFIIELYTKLLIQ